MAAAVSAGRSPDAAPPAPETLKTAENTSAADGGRVVEIRTGEPKR